MSSPCSTSSDSESTQLEKVPYCQVCGQKSHGIHFGAVTCRACAAFFRRVAAGANFVVKCRKGGGNCEIVKNGRSCCKKCRLKKCHEIGMDIQNFQYHRDLISTSRKIIPSLANFLGRPNFIIFCDPETASSSQTTPNIVDVSELVERASRILDKPKIQWGKNNRLQAMAFALNLDRLADESELTSVKKIGLLETMSFWEHDFLAVTRWLTHFDEFQDLERNVKLKFLKSMWHIWNRLEKIGRSCWLRKRIFENAIVIGSDVVLNLKEMELDISWMTRFSVEQVAYYIEGVGDWSIFELINPITELEPSEVELTFMLAQLSFQYAGSQLQGEFQRISEDLIDILSDELHNYYTQVLGMPRYSERLGKMMKVNNMMREFIWKKREKMQLARTFDIFNVKFSEPDMFCDIY